MRNATVWAAMFGVEKSTVIDGVEFEDDSESIVVSVRSSQGREAALRGMSAALSPL